MNESTFQNLVGSIKQAKAIRAGSLQPSRVTKLTPEHPRAVRARLNLTQEEFAAMIGVPLGTLRNWEQGHREPTGPAKALLRVASLYPTQAAAALAAKSQILRVIAPSGRHVAITRNAVGQTTGRRSKTRTTPRSKQLAHA